MNTRTRKFLSYYEPYLGLFALDMACALVLSATTLALPLCARHITKNVLATTLHPLSELYWMGGLMLGLLALHVLCKTFVDYQGHVMGALMERDMRKELFEHCQKLSFSFYDEHKTGQLMTRISHDSYNLAELFHHGPEDIVVFSLNILGALLIMYSVNAELATVVLFFLVGMVLYASHFNNKMNVALRQSKDRIEDINAQIEDTLGGIRVVKSFTNDAIEREKFAARNNQFLESRRRAYKSEVYFFSGIAGFTQLMSIAVIVLGGARIVAGSLDLADLLLFLLCVGILAEPINKFENFIRLYQEGTTGFARFMEILEIPPAIQDKPHAVELNGVKGDIEFRNVGFKYKEDHQYVLKNLHLRVKAGEYVALVGASGIGKTTLCSLLPRFYDVMEGAVFLDGHDVRDIQLKALRKNVGIVQQDIYLFAGSVADNIRYGKLDATDDEIIEAAKKANAHEFIMKLPRQYETDVGHRGVKLSGGQKQRLSVARVFLKNPPILIFDEATSSLDNESERAVQESLERLRVNRTTLVIAHRLTTVQNAERVIVLTDRGVEEQVSQRPFESRQSCAFLDK